MIPPSDAVGHPSDAFPLLSYTIHQHSGAVSDTAFLSSVTVTETVPMQGAGNYEVAGLGLEGGG